VLTQFAHRLVGLLRAGDLAARVGGDEFAVLCEDAEPRHAASIAARLSAAAAEPFLINNTRITLSAAVGGSPAHVADPAELLSEADRSMYETKRRTAGAAIPEPRGGSHIRPRP
jgi:diguanylate cyclase (GGDEF)-like protein